MVSAFNAGIIGKRSSSQKMITFTPKVFREAQKKWQGKYSVRTSTHHLLLLCMGVFQSRQDWESK
jgi:hypothetical protein